MKAKTFFIGATLATAAPAHPGELTKEQQTEAIVNAYNEHLENPLIPKTKRKNQLKRIRLAFMEL